MEVCAAGLGRLLSTPVGSHFYFFEVNRALELDRPKAKGLRLNVPAGAAVCFEPGDERDVEPTIAPAVSCVSALRLSVSHDGLTTRVRGVQDP